MEDITNKLKELSDEDYRLFHSKLCPGIDNILGVRVPVIKKYVKELLSKYEVEDILININNVYYEEKLLRGLLIGMSKLSNDVKIEKLRDFVKNIDNWAICDITCASIKSFIKDREKVLDFIDELLKSNHTFEIRFGIVLLLDYYITDEYIDLVLQKLENIKSDEYYVNMAIAWAISICYIKYIDKTIKVFEEKKLSTFVNNKAVQKITESYRVSKENKQKIKIFRIKE